jgi:tyrosyl-tRNA synthetase
MIAKDSVRARMEDREVRHLLHRVQLHAAPGLRLRTTSAVEAHGCTFQVGATDQWGNITAGIDLCPKKARAPAHSVSPFPCITKSRTAPNTAKPPPAPSGWIPNAPVVYRFYQFFVQAEDNDVLRLLKVFTFLPVEEIEALGSETTAHPEARLAQKRLARELTHLVHGSSSTDDAIRASDILFGGSLDGITEALLREVVGEVPTHPIPGLRFDGSGVPLTELLVLTGLSASKGQARKDIQGGGVYLNNLRESQVDRAVLRSELLHGRVLLLRKGKRNYAAVDALA